MSNENCVKRNLLIIYTVIKSIYIHSDASTSSDEESEAVAESTNGPDPESRSANLPFPLGLDADSQAGAQDKFAFDRSISVCRKSRGHSQRENEYNTNR